MSKINSVSPQNPEGFIRDIDNLKIIARHDADVAKASKR